MRDERIGTVHRTQVIELLNQALDEGHLDQTAYDDRLVRIISATYASDLLGQVQDLPPRLQWDPANACPPTPPNRNAGRAALILGIVAVPSSFCFLGGLLGMIAIIMSFRSGGTHGVGPALIGRVLGIVSLVLTAGAIIALVHALHNPVSP
jgi:hypothetical protein